MRKRGKRLLFSTVGVLAVSAIAAGIAWALWSASGSGSGAGGASIAKSLGVTASSPTGSAASLYPGGPAGSVYFQIANPNPYAITITSLQWGTPTSTSTSTCASSNISLDANAPTTASISIPANATAGTAYQINNVLDLSHNAPDGCQGVTFNVPLTVLGVQQ
jgi:hypothetical protein